MKLQRVIEYNELLVDLASEPEGGKWEVADEDEEEEGREWFLDHAVTPSTAKLFIQYSMVAVPPFLISGIKKATGSEDVASPQLGQ